MKAVGVISEGFYKKIIFYGTKSICLCIVSSKNPFFEETLTTTIKRLINQMVKKETPIRE